MTGWIKITTADYDVMWVRADDVIQLNYSSSTKQVQVGFRSGVVACADCVPSANHIQQVEQLGLDGE